MNRRMLRVVLILAGASWTLLGCDATREARRDKHASDTLTDPADAKVLGESTPTVNQGFFKSSRLPGAMSSEGRDIEQSLGVH